MKLNKATLILLAWTLGLFAVSYGVARSAPLSVPYSISNLWRFVP